MLGRVGGNEAILLRTMIVGRSGRSLGSKVQNLPWGCLLLRLWMMNSELPISQYILGGYIYPPINIRTALRRRAEITPIWKATLTSDGMTCTSRIAPTGPIRSLAFY